MGKYEKKKVKKTNKAKARKSRKGVVIAIVLILILAALALFIMPQVLYKLSGDAESAENETTVPTAAVLDTEATEAVEESDDTVPKTESATEPETPEALSFPLTLEEGKLEIESVFQYDGINPDCSNQEGKNVAAITVKNLSDTYLARADITVTSGNGTVLCFSVTDLPAGKAVMAFSVDNAASDLNAAYGNVTCDAVFDVDASMNEDKISVSVEGVHVTLENNTDAEIDELVVYCHSTMGDQYFGGITYTYTVNNLEANGTAELDAMECILGLAEVVRIVINEP